jgi:hypothetical protein
MDSLLHVYHLQNNRFIRDEVKNVLASIFSMIKPSKKSVNIINEALNDAVKYYDRIENRFPNNPIYEHKKELLLFYDEIVVRKSTYTMSHKYADIT